MRRLWMILVMILVMGGVVSFPSRGNAEEFVVYSVYKALDLGNPGEVPQKDFYVNMGSSNGLHDGASLEVLRRSASYDLVSQKLYKDVTFPIARLKVIHVEGNAAIARLDKMLPPEKTPAVTPRAVMVGDLIRAAD